MNRRPPSTARSDGATLIASEPGRPVDAGTLPDEAFISVVTIAELQVGVLAASETATRSQRLAAQP